MTIHFAFFLLDVTIWLIMGFFLGKILDTTESVAKKRRGRNGLLFMGIAFLSGCWSVLTRGLPDQGISLNSIAMVGFAIFWHWNFESTPFPKNSSAPGFTSVTLLCQTFRPRE